MFLLASAFVAFQGWPQVASQSAPVLVSVPRVSAPAGTRVSRALSATPGAPTRGVPARTGAAAGPRATTQVNPTHVRRGSDQTTVTPISRDPGTSTRHPTGPTPTPRTCATGCSHSGNGGSGPVPTVKKTVQGATHNAGSTVGNAVTTVRKVLPIGKSSNNGVSRVVTTVTSVVKGVTGGLP
jgi:hypothetical protein